MSQKPTTQPPINVLSLFDGISCSKLALDRTHFSSCTINYHSSEISPSALKIQNYNFSADTTFHPIGDVRCIQGKDYSNIDLAIFGSPCTAVSQIGLRTGINSGESALFFEAIRILKEIKASQPKGKQLHFLMENVVMSNKDRDIVTAHLEEVFPREVFLTKVDSSICSPGHRRRYYWHSWSGVTQPDPVDINFQDILVNGYTDRKKANVLLSNNVTMTNGIFRHYKMGIGNIVYQSKEFAELPTEEKLLAYPVLLKASGYTGRTGSVVDQYAFPNSVYRGTSVLEEEKIMTIPQGHVSRVPDVSVTEKHKAIGLSFTVDVVAHLLKSSPLIK